MATQIQGDYFGDGGKLFSLYIKTALLTLITLGIYRFWAKTRIRKYVWSAISGDGDSFEYTGTGLEKFLGFLVAIVILAIYLGIVQMLLLFFGLNLFVDPAGDPIQALWQLAAIYITFFAVLPLLLFAQYRARRYRMSRTRWRGLRFGMVNGAWAYTLRALGYYLLNILTIGLLSPLVTFKLEKFMVDRTWYGDAKFIQNGRWQRLYRGMKHFLFALLFMAAFIGLGYLVESVGLATIGLVVGYIWFILASVYYNIYALNYMAGEKLLDHKVSFLAVVRTGKILGIMIIGMLAIFGLLFVVGLFGSMLFAGFFSSFAAGDVTGAGVGPVMAILGIVLYVGMILLIGGVSLVLITQPIIRHVVESITVTNADHLDTIRQRAADAGADAEGFADALDIGAAL
jgi:hypothetical protein